MPFNLAELVTVKGDVNLTLVQIYPGFGGQHGQPWRFAMVSFFYFYCASNIKSINYVLGNASTNEHLSW